MALSYVLPVRMSEGEDGAAELTGYLARLTRWCNEVIVVDGSPPTVFSRHARVWDGLARHVAPDPAHTSLNGKVQGVLTGVDLASNERVIIADWRWWREDDLAATTERLEPAELAELLGKFVRSGVGDSPVRLTSYVPVPESGAPSAAE